MKSVFVKVLTVAAALHDQSAEHPRGLPALHRRHLIMLRLGWLCIKVAKRILRVPRDILMPVIVLFCIVGAFAINNTAFDVGIMLIAGLAAWLLEENDFPITPLILGVVLGGMLEENFISSMIKSDGNVAAFFSRSIAVWFWPLLRRRRAAPAMAGP